MTLEVQSGVSDEKSEAVSYSRTEIRPVGADTHRPDHPVRRGGRSRVDRITIATLRKVARDGAISALQAARPGQGKMSAEEASEAAKLRAEVDRLGAVVIDQAVELAVLRGKSSWG